MLTPSSSPDTMSPTYNHGEQNLMENCGSCKFSRTRTVSVSTYREDEYQDQTYLFCARNPPGLNFLQKANETGWPMAEFPVVHSNMWCGEYVKK